MMGRSMVKLSGQKYKQQLEVMVSSLLAYRNSHMVQDRDKRAPFSVLMDIIHALYQQHAKYLSTATQLLGQTGKAHPGMLHSVVESQCSDLPANLKEVLSNTMQYGVRTSIPTPERTTTSRESRTAQNNREAAWAQLRKFVTNGWLRAFPSSAAKILAQWQLRMSSTHFVEATRYNKETLVTDLGNPGGADEGQDANSLSPDLDYADVQAVLTTSTMWQKQFAKT